MRTKRQWLSILLVLAIVAGALGFGSVHSVAAYGTITNLQISDKYILTWDAYEGADSYTLQMPGRHVNSNTNSFDANAFMMQYGKPSGRYSVCVMAYGMVDGTREHLATSAFLYFDYVSSLPKLSTPQNIRLEGNEVVWDPVKATTDDEVKYSFYHECLGGKSYIITNEIITNKTRVPISELGQHGTFDYKISIKASAANHQDSDRGIETISITRTLPALQNLEFSNGVLSWDVPEDQGMRYYSRVATSGSASSTNATSITKYNGRYYWNVSFLSKQKFSDGTSVHVSLLGYDVFEELERIDAAATQVVEFDYVVQTEVYPLKYMGKQVTSADRVFTDYHITYIPSINTLDLYDADLSTEVVTGYDYEAVFESSQDLTVAGYGELTWHKPMFKVNGQLIFAEDSDMEIYSNGYAVSADKILFSGKKLYIAAANDDALVARSAIKIGMTDESITVATTSGYSAFTCANGKITLDRMHIERPVNGTLGEDAKHIYESDGRTAAAEVRLIQATVTPTPFTDKTVEVGKSFQYTVPGVSASSINWSIGNTAVATVDANGKVTGKSVGNTYLHIGLPDGTSIKCLVRVVYPELKIRYTEKTLHINQKFAFTVTGDVGQKITWSVGNASVATVDANGKVTGKSAANTYLYAKSADGRVAKCLLKVIDPGTLGINYTEKTVYLGQSFTFTAKNAGILKPTWSVGNTAIATVDPSTGKVTSVSVGNTYLYVKTEDGRSARCLIKVVDPGPLNIRYTEKTIKVGSSFQFTAKNPAGQTVTWRVGNTAVATVDANGNVTGKKAANTWLYASTPDGRETKCLIKVVA